MGDCCIYDYLEQCFHNCDNCPQKIWGEETEPEYDPYDKYDRYCKEGDYGKTRKKGAGLVQKGR